MRIRLAGFENSIKWSSTGPSKIPNCSSRNEKLNFCSKAGANVLVNYSGENFKKTLKESGVYGSVDVVFDPVGGRWSEPAMRSMAWGGRFVVIGFVWCGTFCKTSIAWEIKISASPVRKDQGAKRYNSVHSQAQKVCSG